MKLAEWRKVRSHGEDVVLPSGLGVRLRRISLLDLIANGDIPQLLIPAVQGMVESANNFDISNFPDAMKVANVLCKACFIFPNIIDFSDDDSLGLDELPANDKLFVLQWTMQPAEAVHRFLGEQDTMQNFALNGSAVQATPE